MNIVRKYSSYLVYQLLESIMITSDEFKNIIQNMPSDNKISDVLYTIINDKKDIKTSYNLVDVSPDKNDEIQFLPDNQYQRFVTNGDDVSSKSKSKAKIGRMIGQILRDNGHTQFADSDIEKFVNSFKSIWDRKHGITNRKIEVVRGDDILSWYNMDKYNSTEGVLGNSCMRYDKVNHFMKIYADNPDKISMVILTEDGKLLGRALFWSLDKCESDPKNKFYLDRIYTEKDSDVEFIWNWVFENLVKKDISILASYKTGGNNGLVVNLNKTAFSHYPYEDTLNFLYEEVDSNGKISGSGYLSDKDMSNSSEISKKYVISEIRNHSAGIKSTLKYKYSKNLDIYILNGEAFYMGSDWYPKTMGKFCEYLDEWMLVDDAVWSEAMEDWIPKSKAIDSEKYGLVLRDALSEIVTGFNRKYKNPLDAYIRIKSNSEEDCIVENLLPSLVQYSTPEQRIGDYRYYLKELLKKDIWDDYQIAETMIEVYNVGDYSSINNKYTNMPIIERYGDAYVTKDDAIIYGISISIENESNYISIKNYIPKFTEKNYSKLMTQISKLDKNTQKKVIGLKKEMNTYLMNDSSTYRSNQEIFTKFKELTSIEIHNEVHNISWNNMIDEKYDRFILYLKRRFSEYSIELTKEQIVNVTKMMYVYTYFYLNTTDSNDSKVFLRRWINENGYEEKFKLYASDFNGHGVDNITEMLKYAFRDGIDDIYNDSKYVAFEYISKKYDIDIRSIEMFISKANIGKFNLDIENVKTA